MSLSIPQSMVCVICFNFDLTLLKCLRSSTLLLNTEFLEPLSVSFGVLNNALNDILTKLGGMLIRRN